MITRVGSTDDAANINRSGKHLLALINGTLGLSKIEAGKIELHVETFDVPALIDEGVNIIRFDRIKLRQILLNLLSDACKFTGHSEIHLQMQSIMKDKTEWLHFQVSDTG